MIHTAFSGGEEELAKTTRGLPIPVGKAGQHASGTSTLRILQAALNHLVAPPSLEPLTGFASPPTSHPFLARQLLREWRRRGYSGEQQASYYGK
jgi:hypothetical protein